MGDFQGSNSNVGGVGVLVGRSTGDCCEATTASKFRKKDDGNKTLENTIICQ